jgi:phosphoglycerol transferase MdoB-like AlkP superfamily enzyme
MAVITAVFLVLGSLARLLFFALYAPADWKNFASDLAPAFFLGVRFDLTVLCYVHSLPLLFLFFLIFLGGGIKFITKKDVIDLNKADKTFNRLFLIYYAVFLAAIVAITAFDTFYYSFYQDRLNVLIFGIFEDDTQAILKTIWKNYPVIPFFIGHAFLGVALVLLLKFLQKRFPLVPNKSSSFPKLLIISFLIFVTDGALARGSFGLFPLSEMDTHISKSIFMNVLSYNSVHAFSRAVQNKKALRGSWDANLKDFGYGSNYKQAFADFFRKPVEQIPDDVTELIKKKTPVNSWAETHHPHVLLIVMESFGAYWARFDKPEFNLLGDLKKHFKEDFLTLRTLSGTGSTVGSLSSLIAGVPQKTTSEFLPEGPYMHTPFKTAPARIFKSAGYQTHFVYGGNPGWRDMNKYATTQGFESIEGEHDIEESLKPKVLEKHDWGNYDEDVWEYLWKALNDAKDPQFIITMTTTNHPPYQLPSTYKSPINEIPDDLKPKIIGDLSTALNRFRTFRYSNDKLAQFLDRIKNSPLKDKVVVAVTGDHTFWTVNFAETQFIEKGAVPFYLYSSRPKNVDKSKPIFASHSDIPATLYEEALSGKEYYSFNKSVFDPTRKNVAVTSLPFIVGDAGAVMMFPKDPTRKNYFTWDPQFSELSLSESLPELEDMAVYYKSLMGSLDYYFWHEKNAQSQALTDPDRSK